MYTLPSYFVILCEGGNSEDPCIETSSGREKRSPQAGGAALAALGLGGNLSLGLDGISCRCDDPARPCWVRIIYP